MTESATIAASSPESHAKMLTNVFSVDVEDYFQVIAFERHLPRARWDDYPSRVVPATLRLLDLLEHHQVRGTFFVLGWVARKFPRLVRAIHKAGHEVGSHGYWHRLIYTQTAEEFRRLYRAAPKEIADLLATEGYYRPVIEASLDGEDDRLRARFTIDPGRPVSVSAVTIAFVGALAEQDPDAEHKMDRLRGSWGLGVGRRFRHPDWEEEWREPRRQEQVRRVRLA